MNIVDFNIAHRAAPQGDLMVFKLDDREAAKLSKSMIIRPAKRGSIRLLEGEVTGHHHEIVMDRDDAGLDAEASAIADAALAIARARASVKIGVAVLYQDDKLAASLTWLLRRDLMIGFLCIEGGPVVLQHPEHDAIRLPTGVFYIGRQVESAGAEERVVQD